MIHKFMLNVVIFFEIAMLSKMNASAEQKLKIFHYESIDEMRWVYSSNSKLIWVYN